MHAVIYTRVSTSRQAEKGQSLAAQADVCRKYCEARGWKVLRSFSDKGASAFKRRAKLVGLDSAIQFACDKQAIVVVFAFNRFGRSMIDSLARIRTLTDAGASLASVNEGIDLGNTMGRLILKIMLAFAEAESETIGDRVRSVNARTVERLGYRTQAVQPAGFKVIDGKRVEVPEEREVVERAAALRKTMSAAKVAKVLASEGVRTIAQLRGKEDRNGWSGRRVADLLKSAAAK